MSDELSKNIDAIQEQASSMLENIRAIRGEDYAHLVQMIINLKNMTLFFSICLHYSKLQKESQKQLDKQFMNSFENMLDLMQELTGIDTKELKNIITDAKAIDDAANRLLQHAIFRD